MNDTFIRRVVHIRLNTAIFKLIIKWETTAYEAILSFYRSNRRCICDCRM